MGTHNTPLQPDMADRNDDRIGFAARMFKKAGKAALKLPEFRGRTRVFLTLFKILGLHNQHVKVTVWLTKPTVYCVRLDLHSWLQRIAFLTGGYEEDTVQFLVRLCESDSSRRCFLDIGANVGLISIPWAILLQRAGYDQFRLISIEAVSDNHEVLKANVQLNHLETNVVTICAALGDSSKVVDIQVEGDLDAGEGTGTANILSDGSTYGCVRQRIPLLTLNQLQATGQIPSGCAVIKIDTDGYDLKVLEGSTDLLNRDRPVIFGEFAAPCMSWHGQSLTDVISLASRFDYVVWQRVSNSWLFSNKPSFSNYVQDLLLVPRERAVDFSWCLSSKNDPPLMVRA